MRKAEIIVDGIYLIGGPDLSSPEDATVFIIDFAGELVMIDSGAGNTFRLLVRNIEDTGLNPQNISTLVLTHCHIDHIGAAPYFRKEFGCELIAHDLDADAIETGNQVLTAANWYGLKFPPTPVGKRLTDDHDILRFGDEELHCIHTPGHTPGSISLYIEREGKRILFGQDIHGPFLSSFGSDIEQWKNSMEKLLALEADILCEGHFGIFYSKNDVKKYIQRYMSTY